MKYFSAFLGFSILLVFSFAGNRNPFFTKGSTVLPQDTIYTIPLNDIDGVPISLVGLHGRKLLIVILPLSSQDSSVTIDELSAIQARFGDSLVVVGVPAEEFGYNPALKTQIKNLYSSQPAGFVITEGMKVKKTSGAAQSLLFQWLTHYSRNHHFDREVKGTGDKFFVNEEGVLYAVFGMQIKLSSPVVEKILAKRIAN